MNGAIEIQAIERRQAWFIRWMMVLSSIAHGLAIIVGCSISSLFPDVSLPRAVTVELTDAPISTVFEEPPAIPDAPVPLVDAVSSASKATAATGKTGSPAAQRWLERLDAGLAGLPDTKVSRNSGRSGGMPVRNWENKPDPIGGDFPPDVAHGKNLLLAKQLDDLEKRLRESGHPGVGAGDEAAVSTLFGGTRSGAGNTIPPWIRDMIRRKVRGYLPELEAEYSAALQRNPGLKGRMTIRFRIDSSGRIQKAESAEASFRDAPFTAAIVEKVLRWTFEPIGGRTVEVLYPFVFTAPS